MFDNPPGFTLLCYSQKQNLYQEMYKEGLLDKMILGYPSYEEIEKLLMPHKSQGSILIIGE